jgi:hypothetical protein
MLAATEVGSPHSNVFYAHRYSIIDKDEHRTVAFTSSFDRATTTRHFLFAITAPL